MGNGYSDRKKAFFYFDTCVGGVDSAYSRDTQTVTAQSKLFKLNNYMVKSDLFRCLWGTC